MYWSGGNKHQLGTAFNVMGEIKKWVVVSQRQNVPVENQVLHHQRSQLARGK